jgi:8-oxo-dGTP pyrophosphatase MutT (NUDIX family)
MDFEEENFVEVVNDRLLRRKVNCSYSVIVHTLINGKIHYLLGKVRDTIPFKEYMKCCINPCDIPHYINHMTLEEKYRILTEPFKELLEDVIVNHSSRIYHAAIENEELYTNNKIRDKSLLTDQSIGLKEAQWIFPKGHKNQGEYEEECALREFEEEVKINKNDIELYDITPFEETYYGLDGKLYKTVYFLGFIPYDKYRAQVPNIRKMFIVTERRTTLSEEIAKIKWLDYDDAINKLDESKRYILRSINTYLMFCLGSDKITRRHSI